MANNVSGLTKEFGSGMNDMYKESGLDAVCKEMNDRLARLKDELLLAWFAEHGWTIMIRERTKEEEYEHEISKNRVTSECEYCGPGVRYPSIMKFCPYCGREFGSRKRQGDTL